MISTRRTGLIMLTRFVFFLIGITGLAGLFVTPALAADITITAAQQEYFFLAGQPLTIPLNITSTFPQDIKGTLQFSTDEQLQKPGAIMIQTENRVSSQIIPPGTSVLNPSAGTTSTPLDYKVHISFYYAGPGPVQVTLPEIIIHIVANPDQIISIPSLVTGTSAPGSGNVPTSSSVQIHEQPATAREQMGSDSGTSTGQGPSGSRVNTTALQEQLEKEQEQFDNLLVNDPLFSEINRSLIHQGFSIRSADTRPSAGSGENGTFSIVLGKGVDNQVVLEGTMQNGIVPGVTGSSNTGISVMPAFDTNITLASFDRHLMETGYQRTETDFDRTLANSTVNLTYTNPQGNKAFIQATEENGNVTVVSMSQGTGLLTLAFVVVIAATGIAVVSFFLYRRYTRRRAAPSKNKPESPTDHSPAEVILMTLVNAEDAYARGQYQLAYRLAAQTIRSFFAQKDTDQDWISLTNTEIITVLIKNSCPNVRQIEEILARCADVEFAKGEPDDQEFFGVIETIRGIISRD